MKKHTNERWENIDTGKLDEIARTGAFTSLIVPEPLCGVEAGEWKGILVDTYPYLPRKYIPNEMGQL